MKLPDMPCQSGKARPVFSIQPLPGKCARIDLIPPSTEDCACWKPRRPVVSSKLGFLAIALAALFTPNSVFNSAQQTEFVAIHNRWRKEVGAPPLKWSSALAATAQAWADHLKEANGCKMQHSHSGLGENLHWASPATWSDGRVAEQVETPTLVVNSWASEKQDYNHRKNSCAPGAICGHYTQVVWRDTKQFGCGRAVCEDLSQIWVCNYQPAGNYVGQKPY